MANDTIAITENGQTLLQAFSGTVAGKNVKAETVVLVNSALAEKIGQTTRANSIPVTVASDQGALGSVSITGTPTVTANQGTPAAIANKWPVIGTDGTNTESIQPDTSSLLSGKTGIVPMGFDPANGFFGPLTLVPGQLSEVLAVSLQGAGVGVPLQSPGLITSGTNPITASGQSVQTVWSGGQTGTPIIEITGTFTGTMVVEAIGPTTVNFYQVFVKNTATGQWLQAITAPALYQVQNVDGIFGVRVRSISWTSGSATINFAGAPFPQTNQVFSMPPNLTASPETVMIGAGSQGGGLRSLQADINGKLLVSQTPDPVTTIPPNFVSPTLPWYIPLNPAVSPANTNPLFGYTGYRTVK